MGTFYIARESDIEKNFNKDGFSMTEVLPGTYAGGIRNYKCYLNAGCKVAPEVYKDTMVLIMFGKGKGYVTSDKDVYNIEELSFYVPNFDKEPYVIHAVEDMEFMFCVIEMNQWDWEVFNAGHVRVPFFLKYSDGIIYDQDCKLPGTTSWSILSAEQMGRIMVGVCRADGGGTVEKGHPVVEQWNYCVGDSDFTISVDGSDPIEHKAGEFSYIPAGYDHSLVSEPGKEIFYVWFEHFTREKDFSVTLAEGELLEDKL